MPKRARARGMNAALDSGEAGVGEMRPARSPMRPRQLAVASVVALAGSGLGVVTYQRVTSGPVSFTGQVTPSHTYFLNFPSTGTVLTLAVRPGDHVVAGQVLATMDGSVAAANLAAARAAVTADEAVVAADQAPQAGPAQQAQDQLGVTQASAAVTAARTALSLTQGNGQHLVAVQSAVVAGAQNAYATDSAHYAQQCAALAPLAPLTPGPSFGPAAAATPGGPGTPGGSGSTAVPAPGSPGTSQSPVSWPPASPSVPPPVSSSGPGGGALLQFCQNLQSQLGHDATEVSTAQAELAKIQSAAQLDEARDVANVTQGQAVLAAAQQKVAAAGLPLTPAVIAQAQAQLADARAQVAQYELAVKNATLVAPADGVVADVAGAAGDVNGPDGVHTYAGPAAQAGTQAAQQPGFQLFVPSGGGGVSAGGPASAYRPLLTVDAGPLNVTAQVPEQDMAGLRVGQRTRLEFPATGTWVSGTVGQVMLDPARVPGDTVYYNVLITLDVSRPEVLAGMTVNVSLF